MNVSVYFDVEYNRFSDNGERELVVEVSVTDEENNTGSDKFYITKNMLLEVLNSGNDGQ